jgi:hypothetical protein
LSTPSRNRVAVFRVLWRIVNVLLVVSLAFAAYGGAWEHSVRRYLDGFSDAIVPDALPPEQKIDLILSWMRSGPPRPLAANPEELSKRDPENTLNYSQLLQICGTATNAFLNLARSSDLDARRLLLLDSDHKTKHVVAEVLVNDRWIVVDPTYRTIMRDAQGRALTRSDLKDPAIFAQATGGIPNYPPSYSYESFTHVRLARLPFTTTGMRQWLRKAFPTWDEAFDWSLLLERESYFFFFASTCFFVFFLLLRLVLAWYADHRLRVPRYRFRHQLARAGASFLYTPEIKE